MQPFFGDLASGVGNDHVNGILLLKLGRILDQSPGPDIIAGLGGGPVVEDDLVKDQATLLVVEMVELDEINRFAGHVLLGRGPVGNNDSAESGSYGTHQSPPCCR